MKVKELMIKDVITVEDRKSIGFALALMNQRDIRRLPVLSEGALVGMIVQHDIEKALHRPGVIPETPVEWIMSKHPVVIGPEESVVRAAELLVQYKISGLPVMEQGIVLGIISEIDILKMFIEILRGQE